MTPDEIGRWCVVVLGVAFTIGVVALIAKLVYDLWRPRR